MTGLLAALNNQVVEALSVTEVPSDVTGYGNSGAIADITTGKVEAIATGGIAPYAYAWSQVSSSPYTWNIGSPTAASTDFTCAALGPGNTAEATFECAVTDAAGVVAKVSVTAFANNGQPYDNRVADRRTVGEALP